MKNKILASLFVLTFVFATTLSAQTPVTTTTGDNSKKTECKHDGKCKDKKAKCCKEGKEKKAGCCKEGKEKKEGCCKEGKAKKAGCCKDGKGKEGCKGHEGKAGCPGHGNAPADSSACPHHKKAIETGTPDNK
jgi:hypothetical protein